MRLVAQYKCEMPRGDALWVRNQLSFQSVVREKYFNFTLPLISTITGLITCTCDDESHYKFSFRRLHRYIQHWYILISSVEMSPHARGVGG